jgi:hypothetical protein
MSLRYEVCLARHGYHLIEWWTFGLSDYQTNEWRCRWCGYSRMENKYPRGVRAWYCRMNGPIEATLWDGLSIIQRRG